MSLIKRCDRCDRLEDPRKFDGGIFPVRYQKIYFGVKANFTSYDLCFECFDEFLNFKNKPN